MKNLIKIEKQIDKAIESKKEIISFLEGTAKKEFEKQVKLNKKLKKSILKIFSDVEKSKELTQVEHDEYFNQWCHFEYPDYIDTDFLKNLFREYMQEHYNVFFQDTAALYSIGDCIIISDDGSVYSQDGRKTIIKKHEFETENERNELIEKYMEKSGCFPSVVRCDYHGNAFYVNTKEVCND